MSLPSLFESYALIYLENLKASIVPISRRLPLSNKRPQASTTSSFSLVVSVIQQPHSSNPFAKMAHLVSNDGLEPLGSSPAHPLNLVRLQRVMRPLSNSLCLPSQCPCHESFPFIPRDHVRRSLYLLAGSSRLTILSLESDERPSFYFITPLHNSVLTNMVLPCRKSSDHSTLADCGLVTSMSRMQQDLAASQQNPRSTPMSNGDTSNKLKPNMLRQALRSGAKPHVCIIGAGFAGLRCADILLQQGVKVTIFEARNRIGGRVSYPFGCLHPFLIMV